MKMVKSLLLGSAAGFVAIAGAQAADLPVKAKPVEYVKVCSVYGAGFYYIPGTDTCLKVGGYVRAEYNFNAGGSHGPYISGGNARNTREDTNYYNTRTRGIVSFDARSQTEWGTLRSYIRAGWELNSADGYRGAYAGTGPQYFDRAFIQFAGITVGKTQSFFDFYANALNYTTSVIGGSDTGHGINLIAYTAQFGGGFSATVSLEDQLHRRVLLWEALPTGAALPLSGPSFLSSTLVPNYGQYAGQRYPDIVANLRVDQPWGSAQVMAALHDASGSCVGPSCNPGGFNTDAQDNTGWAVGAGVMFNLPWAQGDQLWVQGTWARGAASYLGFNFNAGNNIFVMYGDSGAAGTIGNIGLAHPMDGIFGATGQVFLTEGFQVNAAVQHYWTPALRTSVFGGYAELNWDAPGTVLYCSSVVPTPPGGIVGAVTGTCNPDFAVWQVGTRTIWSPVANLDIGVEVLYTRLDQSHVGNWLLPASGSRAAGVYEARDKDTWSGVLRFQRNFWP
jgi:hypothetical protein